MLFQHLHKASISRYISFTRERLPKCTVQKMIEEMNTVGYINGDSLSHWKVMLQEHNSLVKRGQRLKPLLHHRVSWIEIKSLDIYILQMQGRYLADFINDFSRFGERVVSAIQESPESPLWLITESIAIENRHWRELCAQIISFLNVIALTRTRLMSSNFPDSADLDLATSRARRVFGPFATGSTAGAHCLARLHRKRGRIMAEARLPTMAQRNPASRRNTTPGASMHSSAAWPCALRAGDTEDSAELVSKRRRSGAPRSEG
jgi:hypothetical protein